MARNDVTMLFLRDGQECLLCPAERTALSLHSKGHKEAGRYGSSHLDAFDATFLLPKKPERFDSWEAFVASEPPPLPAVEAKRFALFDEMKFWPQPRDVDNPPGPDDYHDEIVRLYGTAYRLNGVDRATAQDQTNSLFNPLQLAAAFAIVTSIFVAAIGALWWLFAN